LLSAPATPKKKAATSSFTLPIGEATQLNLNSAVTDVVVADLEGRVDVEGFGQAGLW
jgi:hypothetical protein